jgi:hypothetical protein
MTEKDQIDTKKEKSESKPDENAGFIFSSAIKIFNPKTAEILVQKRGDD